MDRCGRVTRSSARKNNIKVSMPETNSSKVKKSTSKLNTADCLEGIESGYYKAKMDSDDSDLEIIENISIKKIAKARVKIKMSERKQPQIESDNEDERVQNNVYRNRKVEILQEQKKSVKPQNVAVIHSNVNNSKEVLKEIHEPQKGTPKKKRSLTAVNELEAISQVTPPKQRKSNDNSLFSPSSLLEKLELNSPPPKENKSKPKKLFESETIYQSARKALHSTVPVQMPGRENEHKQLRDFIKCHLMNKTSGTLYVSGPPGTGKTASLSTILQQPDIITEFKEVYVNCTAIKSSGSIYLRIIQELGIKSSSRTEKDSVAAIENYLSTNHKMILLVLDEIDQLESKKQSVLYTIFEWPSRKNSKIILIGIANALDLTDRILPRLQARCELKPQLMHFAPYSKQQIVEIFTDRLRSAGVLDLFAPVAVQMLAGKVAAISGDVRKALDIGRRVIEIAEKHKKEESDKKVDLKHVMGVLNSVYGTSNNLNEDNDDSFPLQQKIIVCTLLLILKKARNKDITVGKLHEVYKKVCRVRNLSGVDQAEFVGLCSLIETKGIIRVSGKKEPRLHKINLEWDEEEVAAALKDKQLMATILQDSSVLGKM